MWSVWKLNKIAGLCNPCPVDLDDLYGLRAAHSQPALHNLFTKVPGGVRIERRAIVKLKVPENAAVDVRFFCYKKSFAVGAFKYHLFMEELKKKTCVVLRQMCRDQGLLVSGKKDELIARLLKPAAKKSESGLNAAIRCAQRNCGAQVLRRNAYGNFEEPETHFVFDKTKQVIGRQEGDKIVPLTAAEIKICQDNKWLV